MDIHGMDIYLVGGAVRDDLLGQPVVDRDFVVVGQSPQALLERGFKPVGRDFPVFLHPDTGEEYALARTERKTGPGHGGFAMVADPTITIEQDLARRDLTINAIARHAVSGALVDPLGGQADLAARVLRHASPAFSEDPLRVLRVARFAARYADLGFTVAPQTQALMASMAAAGQLAELTAERVWAEFAKALAGPRPEVFIQVLRATGALAAVAPEVDALYGVPQVAEHHPEIDTGIHTEMVLAQAARLAPGDPQVAFAALVHDLGKALTPPDQWPRHLGHEEAGVPPVQALSARWKVPRAFTELAVAVCHHHLTAHRALEARPGTLLALIESVGGLRQPQRMERFILACEADARGRLGLEERSYPQSQMLRDCLEAARQPSAQPFVDAGQVGERVGQSLRAARCRAITTARNRLRTHLKQQAEPAPGRMTFR